MPSSRLHAGALCALLASLCCALVVLPAQAATVSRADAQRAALTALRANRGSAPLIVFRGAEPLKPGTRVAIAGQERLPLLAGASAARSRDALLRAAGVSIVRAPLAARVGREPAWFFYADEGPFQAYQHPGRVVLVGQRSGRVIVTRRFSWPPLLNGRLPAFLRSYAGYRDPRARAFTRLWRPERPQAKAVPATAGGPFAPQSAAAVFAAAPLNAAPAAPRAVASAAPVTDAERRAAAALAAERSCAVRVGDTLGNFYDASSFDRTRSEFGALFNRLARLDGGFLSVRYRVASGTTLQRYVERLIAQRGCADVFLHIAGGGYVHGGEPAVSVGVQGRRDGRLEQHVVTATALRTLIGSNPGATFKLLLDAPGSGAFLKPLSDLPNLLLLLTSARAGQGSFTALPGLVALDGSQLGNGYNRDGLLEFSNRGLRGLGCFLADPAEVDAAIAAQAQRLTRSFLVWMLRRAYTLCGEGSLTAVIPGAPAPILRTPGTTVVPPDEVPPVTPPGPKNAMPVAAPVVVTTAEDTPVTVTLAGSDPDGDPLVFAAAAPTPAGTVSGGDGPIRTFTPAPDFHGTATFSYTVSDGRASATATVTVTVTPVDDPPVVDAGVGTTAFAEDDPPVAVAPGLTVSDPDDATLDGATVAIAAGYESGADLLAFAGQNGISGSWSAATGTLTLTGTASLADYQAALRSITFDNPGQQPSQTPRSIRFTVLNHGADSAPATRALTVEDRNERPVLGGAGGTVTFTEGDPSAVAIVPALTVADDDDATLASATVTLGSGFSTGEDELTFADQSGIAGSWNGATGVLRLTGDATVAAYQAALRAVGYRDTDADDPTPGDRAVSVVVTDGKDASAPAAASVEVVAVNDAPVLSGGGGTVTYVENAAAVAVLPALAVSDVDSPRLASATVSITGMFAAGDDELTFADQAGISGSWDGATGVLRLTGDATVAVWQTALRSVAYRNGSDNPSTANRTAAVTVDDGAAAHAVSNLVTATVAVTAVNDAPRVTAGGGAPTYAEGDATGVVVDPAVTVTDPDDATLASATVAITGGFDAGGDELRFVDGGGITGSWNSATGVLTLTGPATPAAFQTALRAVRLRSTSANPAAGPRTVSFTASDGAATSAAATTTVAFDLVDDAPVLTTSGGTAAWGGSDVAVDPGLTVADPDSAGLTTATVAITGGYVSGEDELTFTDQSGIAGSWSMLTGSLTLTGDASLADWQAALRTVGYRRTGPFLDDTPRTVSFTVANARTSNTAGKTISFANPPQLSSPGAGLAYTENDAARAVDATILVTDADSTLLTGASAEITGGYASGEDLLSASTAGTAITATVTGARVELSGDDTLAHYQQVLRSISYRNASDDPSTATRTVTFTATDGLYSATATNTVTVTAVNDKPVLTTSAGSAAFTEDGPAVAVDSGLTVSDADDDQLTGATVQITAALDATEDRLAFTAAGGISGSWNAVTGTLTMSGTASLAAYQTALRSVTYENLDTGDPRTATRTVAFRVDDGAATSDAASRGVTVTPVDDPPSIASGVTLAYTENDPATAIDPALALSDIDSANLTGGTVAIGAGHAAAEDDLVFVNQSGITGSFSRATGRLTLSGTATVAAYRAALRSVTYANGSETPSEAPRTVTFTASDATGASSATATVTVRAVNDAPVVPAVTTSAVGNTPLYYGAAAPAGRPAKAVAAASVLASATDVDGPGPLRVDVAASTNFGNRGGSVSWNADGTFTYRAAAGFTGTETLSFTVTDQGAPAARTAGQVQVTVAGRVLYVDNGAAAGDGRAETPMNTLAAADLAASGRDDVIYLFAGDGTVTGMGGGVSLLDGQRLLGESEPLRVGGDDLFPGRPGVRAKLAGSVVLSSGNTVAGLEIGGTAGAPAIDGGSGDRDGTLRDLAIDGRASGALRLDGTTGAWTVSDATIRAAGGTGVALTNAGTVTFAGSTTVDVQTGDGLLFSGTTTAGTISSLKVASAGTNTGASVANGLGSLSIPSVDVTTAGPGLAFANSEGIRVGSDGASSVLAGQTAVATSLTGTLTSAPQIELATATSTGGTHGLSIAATGTGGFFRAAGGTLSGHTAAELAVSGGGQTVSYGGAIGDGTGRSVQVANRTGGAVTLSGTIADGTDAGGGIELSGNNGGSTTFSGSSIELATGASPAVSLAYTGAHAVSFSGGGLALRTTTGAGFSATGTSGSVGVTGAGNTIASTGGTALRISGGVAIAAGDATFRSISANGGANGIVLSGTGGAGGLHVTGFGGVAGSGGTIQNATATGVSLANTLDVRLASVKVTGSADDGIAGTGVVGFALTGDSEVTGNGDGLDDSGIELTGADGTVLLEGATVTGNAFRALDLAAGAALRATVTGGTFGGRAGALALDDGIHFEAETGSPRLTVTGATIADDAGDHLQLTSGSRSTADPVVSISGVRASNAVGTGADGGIVVNPGGSGNWDVTVANSTVVGAGGEAITIDTSGSQADAQPVILAVRLTGNTIGSPGIAGSGASAGNGIGVRSNGGATVKALLSGNQIVRYAGAGIMLLQNDGNGALHATVDGNTISTPDGTAPSVWGVSAQSGGASADDAGRLCLALGRSAANTLTASVPGGSPAVRLRQRDATSFLLPGYGGGARDTAAVGTYVTDAQPGITTTVTAEATAGLGFVAGSCQQP